jgi:hypothetical protein
MLYDTSILIKTSRCKEEKLQTLAAASQLCEEGGQFIPRSLKEHKGTKKKSLLKDKF